MTALHVYDPAMCCSTGVCGPSVDPQLARFSADLDWLKSQGVAVTRHNLAQEPAAFAADAAVRRALEEHGENALPLISIDGAVQSTGAYPSRAELAKLAGVTPPPATVRASLATVDAACCTPSEKSTSKGGCC